MKKASDPRHLKRRQMMMDLFAWQFSETNDPKTALEITENLPTIDKSIAEAAPNRPLAQINKIDLAILRLAVFELLINKKEPVKVVIDEAVELAKEFGSEQSSSFINGALGKVSERSLV